MDRESGHVDVTSQLARNGELADIRNRRVRKCKVGEV